MEGDLLAAARPLADQRYGSEAGGSVYVIPKRSSHPQQAVDYLSKMFLTKAGALANFKATGTTPLLKGAKDEFLATLRNTTKPTSMSQTTWEEQPWVFFGPDYYDVELQSYDYVRILPYDPASSKEVPILSNWLNKYIDGKTDLNGALKGAQDDMKSQIGNPYSS